MFQRSTELKLGVHNVALLKSILEQVNKVGFYRKDCEAGKDWNKHLQELIESINVAIEKRDTDSNFTGGSWSPPPRRIEDRFSF